MLRYASVCVALILMILVMTLCPAYAETVAGTLLSLSQDAKTLTIKDGTQVRKLTLSTGTKVLRGQVGKTQLEVAANELAPGDRILATTGPDKGLLTVRASYAVVAGNVVNTVGRKIVFKQGKAVFLNSNAQIALASGKIGTMSDIKPGAFVICRLEPLSKECWTVVVSKSQSVVPAKPLEKTKPGTSDQKTPAPNIVKQNASGPVINSVVIQTSPNLRTGDIVPVELKGTPRGIAKAEIRGIAGPVQLKENTPGVYNGTIPLRTTKVVRDAIVTGYLKINEKAALPAQAKDRVSINIPVSRQLPLPVNMPKVDMTPPPAPPVVPATPPEPPKPIEIAPITILSPSNYDQVGDSLLIKGTGQPGDRVLVQIDYTNGRTGILSISGPVSTQLVAINTDGSFVYGPLSLDGIFNTRGLQYSISIRYPDHPEKPVESRKIFGRR